MNKSVCFKFKFGIICFVFLITIFNTAAPAQKTVPSLKDISEAILVDNKPVLKVSSPEGSGSTEIKLLSRDNEEALVFEVTRMISKNPIGKLFITRTKVIFDPLEYKDKQLNLNKSEIKKAFSQNATDKFTVFAEYSFVQLNFNNEEAKFVIKFHHDEETIDVNSQNTVHNLMYTAIDNFDEALTIFNQLTSGVRK